MSEQVDGGSGAGSSSFVWTEEAGPSLVEEGDALRALGAALEHGGRPGIPVDIVVVSAKALAELHAQFLGDPTETDVITFDLSEEGDAGGPEMGGPDGEIYLSADRARSVSADRGVSARRELILYLVHGALHLCGMDDHEESDRAAMRAAEREVMGALGYPEDGAPHDLEG